MGNGEQVRKRRQQRAVAAVFYFTACLESVVAYSKTLLKVGDKATGL
jgi:hypothetical protein